MFKCACCSVYIAYVASRLPSPTTAANDTEMYTTLQRPAMPSVYETYPAAATATDVATAAGDYDGYELPIPTEMAPSPLYVNTHEAIHQLQAAEQPQYEMPVASP